MNLDYQTLDTLRRSHPAWGLLLADSSPLITSFLHRVFVVPNKRSIAQADLAEMLEDELFGIRQVIGQDKYPREAVAYLDDWAADARGWLRKYYPPGIDEPHFDLTPATEKVLTWLASLTQRAFVGTESRLMTVFELLRQMVEGSETDPQTRIRELQKRRAEIDNEIARIIEGELPLLDDTALRDRFQQLVTTARELLSDFREVEQNFRTLDRKVRERIALWDGARGALLEEILGQRDTIADSDQGRSFRAFWDFLMSSARQEELSNLLGRVMQMPALSTLQPDQRFRRVHYDWLTAGEHTQRTVALLSQQLRRFLDDQGWQENRRIMELLHSIESRALHLRDAWPVGEFMSIPDTASSIELPMERPLFSPPLKTVLASQQLELGDEEVDTGALFSQIVIDKARLASHIRQALQSRSQVSLLEVIDAHPLEHGLAELVAYLALAGDDRKAVFDEDESEHIRWRDATDRWRSAKLPRVIFVR